MNTQSVTGHFWYDRTVKPDVKPPFSPATASVNRCPRLEQRGHDRICRSAASMGLVALVKLRNGCTPVKTLRRTRPVVFADAHPRKLDVTRVSRSASPTCHPVSSARESGAG
jgi:hypothetical protein